MARRASVAVGGYFPAQIKVVRAAGALLRPQSSAAPVDIVDPCAGDGLAVVELAAALEGCPVRETRARIFACEMESSRFQALRARLRRDRDGKLGAAVHGDAFRLQWRSGTDAKDLSAGVLWLNSPYDTDRECVRLEERWLRKFAPVLAIDGVLLFLLPAHALAASAETLAKHFTDFAVYRFPDPYYDAFKQVLVFARRRAETFRADPAVVEKLRAYSRDPAKLLVLPMEGVPAVYEVPVAKHVAEDIEEVRWGRRPLDGDVVAAALRPWRHGDKGDRLVPGVLPDNGAVGYAVESFPVALPLQAGHVANALAVGVFDGVRVLPDDRASGLPPVFAKATFVKDWVDVKDGERRNEDGDVISVAQVQQPRLVMTALDLRRGKYVKLQTSLARKSTTNLDDMTVADFLECYNRGLLETLRTRCTPMYDPADPAAVKPELSIARQLWDAQEPVVAAQLLLLAKYGAGLIEGQTGTGKTSMATAIAAGMTCKRTFGRTRRGARCVVVLCPPHLLADWADEVAEVLPAAQVTALDDIQAAETFFTAPDDGTVRFGLLAETTSKLAHAWAGVGDASVRPVHVDPSQKQKATGRRRRGTNNANLFPEEVGLEVAAHRQAFLADKRHGHTCPACGRVPPHKVRDYATKRLRCGVAPKVAKDAFARWVCDFAAALAPVCPEDEAVTQYLQGRLWQVMVAKWKAAAEQTEVVAARWAHARHKLPGLVRSLLSAGTSTPPLAVEQLYSLLAAASDDDLTEETVRTLFDVAMADRGNYGMGSRRRTIAASLLVVIADQVRGDRLLEELRARDPERSPSRWDNARDRFRVARTGSLARSFHPDLRYDADQGPLFHGYPRGDFMLAYKAFDLLRQKAEFDEGEPCQEPLYAAVPNPRRVPLAEHITRRWKHRIDLVVVDEVHEATSADSAQTRAMMQFRGLPMVGCTGSLSNGYAKSLFAVLYTFSPLFRAEFGRDDVALFVERYGYLKRVLQDMDTVSKEPVAFGTQSSRVVRKATVTGDAPGTVPSFVLKHFLPVATPIGLDELELNLPPRRDFVRMIDPGEVLGPRVRAFQDALVERIKADRFTPLQGKLFGAMGEEWSSADRATLGIGNSPDGIYRACYPASVGGEEVCQLEMLPPEVILPKEADLIDVVRAELNENRRCLIWAWHAHCGLYERLAALLKAALGVEAPILDCEKVEARKRKRWLVENIVSKHDLMIGNPAGVETGFNALTWFSTGIWYQPPGCAAKTVRQTEGRVRRPGQKEEQRFYWLLYKDTSQVHLHQLLQLKAAESIAIDGLDNTSALRAAGVEPVGGVGGFDLGMELYRQAMKRRG